MIFANIRWTLYKHESDKNKKCLSVGNFGIVYLSVAHIQPTSAYLVEMFTKSMVQVENITL